ncbi:hypothetical protein VTO73DRAFT_2034 [Trametes versicolor]
MATRTSVTTTNLGSIRAAWRVHEYDSLTLLVTDKHYVSNSALEASESSSQQQRDTNYAKCPYRLQVPSAAYQLRSPSQNTPLPGNRVDRQTGDSQGRL